MNLNMKMHKGVKKYQVYVLTALLLIICVAGHWFSVLGYVAMVLAVGLMISPLLRWENSCRSFCPRRNFLSTIIDPLSAKRKMPRFLTKPITRKIVVGFFFSVLVLNLVLNGGQVCPVFVSMCTISMIIAVWLGVFFKPKSWCAVCPVETAKKTFGDFQKK